MSWETTAPDGTKSVKANEAILQANTTYTETEMNKDHFWNIGADEDGHHKFAQMPKYTDGAVATPTSPTLDTGMDLVYFSRLKTAVEAPAAGAQNVQPYSRDASGISQLLGMRACCVFDVNAGTGAITPLYIHNISSIINPFTGIYGITFNTELPSSSYMVLANGMKYEAGGTQDEPLIVSLTSGATTASKSTTSFSLITTNKSGTVVRPLQVSFVVFGG